VDGRRTGRWRREPQVTGEEKIAAIFAGAKREGRAARIPFVCCGDPTAEMTVPICEALESAGADIIELGVPWSDPMADGPVIQRAVSRALAGGTGLSRSLSLAADARRKVGAGLVLFTYYNPVLRMGEEAFARRAARAGLDGVLVTDLPLEEGAGLRRSLIAHGVAPVLLTAPTSGRRRCEAIAREGRGFIYCISRTGVTGPSAALPEELERDVAIVRAAGTLPIAVGFGISTPEQVRQVGALADGVVIGSAVVRAGEEGMAAGADIPAWVGRESARLFGTDGGAGGGT